MTILCPTCGQPHSLVWFVGLNSRKLGLFCDKQTDKEGKTRTGFVPIRADPEWELAGTPEVYTPMAKAKAAQAGQFQLVMTRNKLEL